MAESKKDQIQKLQLDINQVTRTPSVLNQNQIQKIWNATPAKYKYQRPAKGGGNWDYIKGSYVRKVLDSVFGFRWDIEFTTDDAAIQSYIKMGVKQVIIRGKLTGWVRVDGEWIPITKSGTGRADIKFMRGTQDPMDLGNDIKAAETDCLKKCASKFGIGADVYEASEFMEIEIVGSAENSDRTKQTEKRIKDAKKALEAEATEVQS